MKRTILAAAMALCFAPGTNAQTPTKSAQFVVKYSDLGGFKAVPSRGWVQNFRAVVATADSDETSTRIIVLETETKLTDVQSDAPHDPVYMTVLGAKGQIISKEALPGNPDKVTVDSVATYPVSINNLLTWLWANGGTFGANAQITGGRVYALDLNAPVGSMNRWTLVSSFEGSVNPGTDPVTVYGKRLEPKKTWIFVNDDAKQQLSVYSIPTTPFGFCGGHGTCGSYGGGIQ